MLVMVYSMPMQLSIVTMGKSMKWRGEAFRVTSVAVTPARKAAPSEPRKATPPPPEWIGVWISLGKYGVRILVAFTGR